MKRKDIFTALIVMTLDHVQLFKGMSENVISKTWQILSGRLQIPMICFMKFQVHPTMKVSYLKKRELVSRRFS